VALEPSQFRQAIIENTLRSCQLFMGLPAADIVAIASFIVSKHLDKGEYLFREGDRSEGFYVVQKGAINVHRVNARATEPTTVLLVPKNDFVDLLRRRPDFALRMLGSMSQHLRVIVGLLDDLTLKDMETRLANWLLKQCPRPVSAAPVEIKLNRTKRVLAAEMGTTSETLSRTLAKFRDQKLLRVTGNTVVVMRPRELQKLLQRNLGEL
jgi:CRP-like cAMP-binding protein